MNVMAYEDTPLTVGLLRMELAAFATKEDVAKCATKDDLAGFATKEDLAGFAMKEDFAGFATKKDVAQCASKEDLRAIGVAVKQDFDEMRKDLAMAYRPITISLARIEGDMTEVRRFMTTRAATRDDLGRAVRYMDKAANEIEKHRELRATRGRRMDDAFKKLREHERRLGELERAD